VDPARQNPRHSGIGLQAGTDDIREAVSLKIIQALLDEGSVLRYTIRSHAQHQAVFPASTEGITYCSSALEAARGAQALLLLTEWEEFRQINLQQVREVMEVPILVDVETFTILTPCARRASNMYPWGAMGREPLPLAHIRNKLSARAVHTGWQALGP